MRVQPGRMDHKAFAVMKVHWEVKDRVHALGQGWLQRPSFFEKNCFFPLFPVWSFGTLDTFEAIPQTMPSKNSTSKTTFILYDIPRGRSHNSKFHLLHFTKMLLVTEISPHFDISSFKSLHTVAQNALLVMLKNNIIKKLLPALCPQLPFLEWTIVQDKVELC